MVSELYVTSLSGQMELLTGYKKDTLAITEQINGEYSLSLELLKTEKNSHAYDLVQEEAKIEYGGQEFTVKNINEKSVGSSAVKSIQAEHIFFGLIDHYFYEQLIENEYTINYLLSRIFNETEYTYSVQGAFQPHFFEAFGMNNVLSLVNLICETFGAEVERNNTHVTFKNKIGNEIDFQFRYKHNTKTISKSVNTNNLSTVIVGYADVDQYGIYHVDAVYRSPLADVYGERHAEPVYADDLVLESSLMQRLLETINDKPEISFSLEFVELKKNGFPIDNFSLGDTVFTIWEPLGIDIQTRIIACTRYPMSNKSPVVTLANHQAKATDILADFARSKQNFEKILTDGGKVKFSAMEEAVKRATVALNNSLTQLEYPENGGIIGRDPTNPNKFVVFKSNGIGITVDGGQTYKEAITADGFVLSAGVIGKLTANNIVLAPSEIGAEEQIFKQSYAPPHAANRMWLNTSTTPEILYRSNGSTWRKVTPTTANEVGAVVNSQTAVFNALTNYGNLKGLFMSGNDLYMNADYIRAGKINANRIDLDGVDAVSTVTGQYGMYSNLVDDGMGVFTESNYQLSRVGATYGGYGRSGDIYITNEYSENLTRLDFNSSGTVSTLETTAPKLEILTAYGQMTGEGTVNVRTQTFTHNNNPIATQNWVQNQGYVPYSAIPSTTNYYTKSEVYTKAEVDNLIATVLGAIN